MIKVIPPTRNDKYGSGYYGAPRGNRTHQGIDLAAQVGSSVLSNIAGKVTKLGYAYTDDPSYRYVQVTSAEGLDYRFFYVEPGVELGDTVRVDDELGVVQNLGRRYDGITPHIHFEVKKAGQHIDPTPYL